MKKLCILLILAVLLLCGCEKPASTAATTVSAACVTHADRQDDGLCDRCNQNLLVAIDLYSINDLHGKLSDGEKHPGVDELTTFLRSKQQEENVILLSAGDMWQGSAESNLTQGLILTDWMNDLGFAAMALGNHEFDWGEAAIETNAAAAEFPFLAINVFDRDTNQRVSYCDASVVVDIGGIQVGVIGAIGDCYSSIAPDKCEGVYFVTGRELTQLVKEESQRLRTQCGADLIIYALHDGYGSSGSSQLSSGQLSSYYDLSLSQGYVDLVFEGHTHQAYDARDAHGIYHLQHRGDNAGGISHAEIRINSVTGSFSVTETDLIPTGSYSSLSDDPIVETLLEKYSDSISLADQVLGYNAQFRSSDWLCDRAAQLYYELGLKTWGDQYAITLGGGFLSTRSPYDLPKGQVTYGQLQGLFPFDNDIVLCSIKGKDLLSKFIRTNNSRYHVFGSWDQIDENATYYIVVDTYTATYAPNRLTIVETYTSGIYARDLLADWVQLGGMEN